MSDQPIPEDTTNLDTSMNGEEWAAAASKAYERHSAMAQLHPIWAETMQALENIKQRRG